MESGKNSNQVQNYKIQGYNNSDEIDLYDLIEILVKNKMIILLTTAILTLGALGGAMLHRAGVHNKQGVNFAINNGIYSDFFYKKAEINISPVEMSDM
ncbi:MAG: Wzz/FepE/Etk N-terminal domain-containing protein, partial [Fusobacteriaceae bacterium]